MRQGRDATTVTTTMERRKFTIGLGALATGSAAAIGTGAFTSVEADRDITVDVADDADAFLKIEPADTPNGDAYAEETEGTVELNFDGSADFSNITGTDGGNGINERARTIFDDVITVRNQGTQDVAIGVDFLDSDGSPAGEGGSQQSQAAVGVGGPVLRLNEGGPNYVLEPGDSVNIGVFFNLSKEDDFESIVDDLETMIIVADADEVDENGD